LILGDNLFHAQGFAKLLQQTAKLQKGATIFGYYVRDPQRYGVVEFDNQGHALSIEEKPKKPKSHYAVPGLYFYDNQVLSFAKELKKSARGELEITDLNLAYLRNRQLTVRVLGRGTAWLDTGTPTSLLEAANFIEAVEQRQGLRLGCIEEVAFRMGYINKDQLIALGEELGKSDYGAYLKAIATEPAMHAD
jgi:glucose-1-phosphate thymidylyltransferase